MPSPECKNQIGNGNIVRIRKEVQLRFLLAGKFFDETFIVSPTVGKILISMCFFKEYSVTIDLTNNLVRFSDLSLQLKSHHGKLGWGTFELKALQKLAVGPLQQTMVPTITAAELDTSFVITEVTTASTRKSDFKVTPAMTEFKDGRTTIQVTNPNAHTLTINRWAVVANQKIFTPGQANHQSPMSLEQLNLDSSHPEDANNVNNQLPETAGSPVDKRWHPTPETCEDSTKLNPIERRIYDEFPRLHELEKLDPILDDD